MNLREFVAFLKTQKVEKKYILYIHPKELSFSYTKLLFNDFILENKIELYVIDTNLLPEYNNDFLSNFNKEKNLCILLTNGKYKNKISNDINCLHFSLSFSNP